MTTSHDVEVWDCGAETCAEELKKGSRIAVDGHFEQGGSEAGRTKIVADAVQFLDRGERTWGDRPAEDDFQGD